MNKNLVTVALTRQLSLSAKEEIILERFADELYTRIVKKLRKYKGGALIIRSHRYKYYGQELGEPYYIYNVIWGSKKIE